MTNIRKLISCLLAFAAAVSVMSSAVFAEANVVVDIDKTYQTIDGFGASYTWYGDFLTTNVNADTGYDWIFNDAEFNILRFRDLNHVGEEYQNALNGYQAYYSYYKAALDRGIDPIVIVTRWEYFDHDLDFMAFVEKDDEGHSYYTLAKNENGEYMYEELADFFVESIKLFFDAGIPVDYFSISNETEFQNLKMDDNENAREEAGFYFGPDENEYHCAYWKAHIAVYNAFKEAFGEYAPKITGAEVMADTAWIMEKYLTPLIENAPDTFDTVAHHLYGSANTPQSYSEVGNLYYGDYTLWQTEYWFNEYIEFAELMANDLIYENVSAFLYWNGVWLNDAGKCLIEIDSSDETANIKRIGNHYIMMHFSKFIKRGYQRVDVQNSSKSTVAAFKSPDSSKLVIVAVNNTDKDDVLTFDIGSNEVLGSEAYRSIGNENKFKYKYWLTDVEYSNEENIIPAQSVTTYVLDMPANPNYVEPTVEKKVNPFLKEHKAKGDKAVLGKPVVIAIIAAAVVLAVVVIVIVITAVSKKKKKA